MLIIHESRNAGIEKKIADSYAKVKFLEASDDNYIELVYKIEFEAKANDYILFPACCYDGNQFDVLKKNYPPMFKPSEAAIDMPVTITDVPRMEKNGTGKIEVTTGDVSVPCVGIFSHSKKKAVLFYTIQEINGINLGLSYERGKIIVTYPHMRKEKIYQWPFMRDYVDKGISFEKNQEIEIPYTILAFDCDSFTDFYRIFFENRKCMQMDDTHPKCLSDYEQFEIQKNKFNTMNWRESGKFYGVGTTDEASQTWQPGWVGGAMSSYALMKLGGELERERGISTLAHLFRTQTKSGFFYEACDGSGRVKTGLFAEKGTENWLLLRKSADVLYYLFKHFELMEDRHLEVPISFVNGTRKLADAFVNLWDTYGQFGQFVDLTSGEIVVGGSTSAAIAPAGLVSAYRYFGNEEYLRVAVDSARHYFERDALRGYTTGGPGEILQCPDSESAFGLLESLVQIYDVTNEKEWLKRCEYMLHFCSSWVVSYNYSFPELSEFARLQMKTIGSVFANVQNKHSAGGICTLSGSSLYKIYQWTGNNLYLELFKDITETISQYMSTNDRPIYSWSVPKDASLLDIESYENKPSKPEKLPEGFICERVNMSDWEGTVCIGGVFNGSCWCETSNLLVLADKFKERK